MSTRSPLQPLRRSLEEVVEIIFDLGLQNCRKASSEENYILLLSRATGGIESFLQRLARGWERLEPNVQDFMCFEWNKHCEERLKDLRKPCPMNSVLGASCQKGCVACSNKIKLNARELGTYTQEFSARLGPEAYFPR